MNDYGTIMSDLQKPFWFRTQIYQFEHKNPCQQLTTNIIQTNQYNVHRPNAKLTDIESDLRNLNAPLSRLPTDRYPYTNNSHPSISLDQDECSHKIVSN